MIAAYDGVSLIYLIDTKVRNGRDLVLTILDHET